MTTGQTSVSRGKFHLTSFAVMGAALLAGPGFAQESPAAGTAPAAETDDHLEDIVVTARRTTERLQDVPVAVTALTQTALRNNNITLTEDLQRLAPGLTIAASVRSNTAPNYTIRGQRGPLLPNSLTDPAVAVYFAEMNQSRSQGTNQALFDLDSVQVLKGSQGTLFGRNSTGGAVLIEPRAPSHDFEGYVQATYGSYDLMDGEAVINIPLGERVQFRAGGKITKRDGYMHNVTTGKDGNDIDSQSYRVQLALQPTDSINSRFIATRYITDQNGTAFKFAAFNTRRIGTNAAGLAQLALFTSQLALNNSVGKYEYANPDPFFAKEDAWSFQNNTTIELGNAGGLGTITFKNVIGWRDIDSEFQDARFPQWTIVNGGLHNRLFTVEPQIQTDGKYLDLVFGGYYFRESGDDTQIAYQGPAAAAVAPATFPSVQNQFYDFRAKSRAAFAHFNYDMALVVEGLSLSGGIRYTEDKRSAVFHNINFSGVNPTSFRCAASGTLIARNDRSLCNVPSRAPTSGEFTYDASLSYKFSPDVMAYVTHRHGYRSGSLNAAPIAGSIILVPQYDPEFVDDVEIGLKTDFDVGSAPARLNIAGYHQWNKDIQRQLQKFDGPINANLIVNGARATIKGFEAEFTIKPTPELTLGANYAYTDAKNKTFLDQYVGTGNIVRTIDVSDSPFAYVPKHQYSASITYEMPMDKSAGSLVFNANVTGQSSRTPNEIYTSNCGVDGAYTLCQSSQVPSSAEMKPYALVNARLDWNDIMGVPIDASLFVNNVFDKYYLSHVTNNYASTIAGMAVAVGAPRMVGVQLRARFGVMAP